MLDIVHTEDILTRKSVCDVYKVTNIKGGICKHKQMTYKHACVHVCMCVILILCPLTNLLIFTSMH